MNKCVKFAICADVHYDLIPDAKERMSEFLKYAKEQNVEFIINLGDLCFPNKRNDAFYDLWKSFDGSHYHVLGNHDLDHNTKEQAVAYFNMSHEYYSFDQGEFHFIVLDPNNLKLNDGFCDYGFGNYFAHPDKINWITDEQLKWLKTDLEKTNKKTILFSHQSLESSVFGIKNSKELHTIICQAKDESGKKKVVACFNGHDHVDGVKFCDDIYYISINGMSFFYMSDKINITRYSETITQKFPILRESVPFSKGLFTVASLSENSLTLTGCDSEFVGPSPVESGHCGHAGGFVSTAKITPKVLLF